ncbi:MAG TPA: hypothetical protein VEB69_12885 [Acidimicrobiia bacterium]|nr:hypothetical protein [Acidimicrobiia bacterium]
MSWVRWLIVVVAIVLIVAFVGYGRGERQRGQDVPESMGVVLTSDTAA